MTATLSDPIEREVLDRYGHGAEEAEQGLCCAATTYDPALLKLLPKEIIEKDYGCGDPSRYVSTGDTVLDLGSGAGKVCYMLSQKVGPAGKVIGLDFNNRMLALARKYQDEMARRIGYANVSFHKARIQDMKLDLERAQTWLARQPVTSVEQLLEYEGHCNKLRQEQPVVADDSVDVIVSNCVLNLVRTQEKVSLFSEMFRVLKRGGRAVISDIVCDEEPTPAILNDPKLWSGCISGAFREDRFLEMFEAAGFHGVEIVHRQEVPWQVIDGIEFRSMTVRAYKGKQGPCMERNQAVVYRGPWKQVRDDDGHVLHRGQRMAVCDKTFKLMTDPQGPYAGQMLAIEPKMPVAEAEARAFDCKHAAVRDPRQTKGFDYRETRASESSACCEPGCGCC